MLEPQIEVGSHREPRDALGIDSLLLLVFGAEQDVLRFLEALLANQSQRLPLHPNQLDVGLIRQGRLLVAVGLGGDLDRLLDGRVELRFIALVAFDPLAIAGHRSHARRHRQHFVQMDDLAAQHLDLGVPLDVLVRSPVAGDRLPHHPAQHHPGQEHCERLDTDQKATTWFPRHARLLCWRSASGRLLDLVLRDLRRASGSTHPRCARRGRSVRRRDYSILARVATRRPLYPIPDEKGLVNDRKLQAGLAFELDWIVAGARYGPHESGTVKLTPCCPSTSRSGAGGIRIPH